MRRTPPPNNDQDEGKTEIPNVARRYSATSRARNEALPKNRTLPDDPTPPSGMATGMRKAGSARTISESERPRAGCPVGIP